MSEAKLLYKLYINDHNSDTFEEFLLNRLIKAERENRRYEVTLDGIINAASIVDFPESCNTVQLKHFAEFVREKAKEARMERIVIPHDFESGRKSWMLATWEDGNPPIIRCPNGHGSVMKNHKIDADGTVNGSVQCPECDWHVWVILEDWRA